MDKPDIAADIATAIDGHLRALRLLKRTETTVRAVADALGLPISWDISHSEWREDQTLRQTITVRCCKACVEEGTAAAIAGEIERMAEGYIEERQGL